MKNYIVFFCLIITLSVSAQKTLTPEIMTYPDISQKAQDEYAALMARFERIGKKIEKDGEESIQQDDAEFYENQQATVFDLDPFKTSEEFDFWNDKLLIESLKASSKLEETKNNTYVGWNVHDKSLKTAWATKTNKGVDQKVTFKFQPVQNLSITQIEIYNGYQKSEAAFKNNSRAKKIEVCMGGKIAYILELEDTLKMQRFEIEEWFLGENKDLTLEFRILEVYKGEKYEDLCISEINFKGKGD